MRTKAKVRLAKEVIVFFSLIGFLLIVFGSLSVRNSIFRSSIESIETKIFNLQDSLADMSEIRKELLNKKDSIDVSLLEVDGAYPSLSEENKNLVRGVFKYSDICRSFEENKELRDIDIRKVAGEIRLSILNALKHNEDYLSFSQKPVIDWSKYRILDRKKEDRANPFMKPPVKKSSIFSQMKKIVEDESYLYQKIYSEEITLNDLFKLKEIKEEKNSEINQIKSKVSEIDQKEEKVNNKIQNFRKKKYGVKERMTRDVGEIVSGVGVLLFIIFYPLRGILLLLIWAFKTLRSN